MKRLCSLALALGMMVLPITAKATVPVIGPSTYNFTAGSQSNIWTCNGGQNSFQLSVPSGLTGTFTVTVSQASGGTYANPPSSYSPGGTSYTNTIANSGSLTVMLGSNAYVKVADTTYSSGSVTVTGSCGPAAPGMPPSSTGSLLDILTSSSPTSCTSIFVENHVFGRLVSIENTGSATVVFPTFYHEGASPTCAAADTIWGYSQALTIGSGQTITLNIPLSAGLAYNLSGALTANLLVIYDI